MTLEQKLNFAKELKVMAVRKNRELPAKIRDDSVVFYFEEGAEYVTFIQVMSRDGKELNKIITRTLPPIKDRDGVSIITDLIYVRYCRV